jgi:hypothetical protein
MREGEIVLVATKRLKMRLEKRPSGFENHSLK